MIQPDSSQLDEITLDQTLDQEVGLPVVAGLADETGQDASFQNDLEETNEMKTINNVINKLKITKKEEVKYEKLFEDLSSWKNNGLLNNEFGKVQCGPPKNHS